MVSGVEPQYSAHRRIIPAKPINRSISKAKQNKFKRIITMRIMIGKQRSVFYKIQSYSSHATGSADSSWATGASFEGARRLVELDGADDCSPGDFFGKK